MNNRFHDGNKYSIPTRPEKNPLAVRIRLMSGRMTSPRTDGEASTG
ncbi:hypothetical protein ABER99_17320 [Paenibacillus glucanolyticus]|nr:hypothetical protein [Paenibacillus glucanolyticus]